MTKLRIFSNNGDSSHFYLDCRTLLVVPAHPFTPGDLYHVGAPVPQEVDKQLLLDLWELNLFQKQIVYEKIFLTKF